MESEVRLDFNHNIVRLRMDFSNSAFNIKDDFSKSLGVLRYRGILPEVKYVRLIKNRLKKPFLTGFIIRNDKNNNISTIKLVNIKNLALNKENTFDYGYEFYNKDVKLHITASFYTITIEIVGWQKNE